MPSSVLLQFDADSSGCGSPTRGNDTTRAAAVFPPAQDGPAAGTGTIDAAEPQGAIMSKTSKKTTTKGKGTKAKATAPKAKAPKANGKVSQLDAAVQVLKAKGEAMNCKAMVDTMLEKRLWKTGGK